MFNEATFQEILLIKCTYSRHDKLVTLSERYILFVIYYFFKEWTKVDFFSIIFRLRYWRVYVDDFLMETRHFINILCKRKVKTFFLSTLIALNVKWLPHLRRWSKINLKVYGVINFLKKNLFCLTSWKNKKWHDIGTLSIDRV